MHYGRPAEPNWPTSCCHQWQRRCRQNICVRQPDGLQPSHATASTYWFDADLGLCQPDVVLNLYPKVTLHDVFTGRATLDEAILTTPDYSVLLAGSGMIEYSRLTPEIRAQFMRTIETLRPRYDIILLDTGAGISDVVLFSVSLATCSTGRGHARAHLAESMPTPPSKCWHCSKSASRCALVINQKTAPRRWPCHHQPAAAGAQPFCDHRVRRAATAHALGRYSVDSAVREAVMRRQLLLQSMPGAPASLAVAQLSNKIKAALTFRSELLSTPLTQPPSGRTRITEAAGHGDLNISCYKFTPLPDAAQLRETLHERAQALNLKGTVLLAEEGINFFWQALPKTSTALSMLCARMSAG